MNTEKTISHKELVKKVNKICANLEKSGLQISHSTKTVSCPKNKRINFIGTYNSICYLKSKGYSLKKVV